MSGIVYTIGHSTHTLDEFVSLLEKNGISAVGDVRSQPYSRRNPQFNREQLKAELKACGIGYVFLGEELGARSKDPACYADGKVRYDVLARTERFQQGLERVKKESGKRRVALMCAEKEPLHCHRAILVSRHLVDGGLRVAHILEDGRLEPHDATLRRLMRGLGIEEEDLFRTQEELRAEAYEKQGNRIAYRVSVTGTRE